MQLCVDKKGEAILNRKLCIVENAPTLGPKIPTSMGCFWERSQLQSRKIWLLRYNGSKSKLPDDILAKRTIIVISQPQHDTISSFEKAIKTSFSDQL